MSDFEDRYSGWMGITFGAASLRKCWYQEGGLAIGGFSLRIGFGDRMPLKKITTRPYR
jgi:hypothetical protein